MKNKYLALTIILTMAFTSFSFAQPKEIVKQLTYEKAVELAIKNSLEIKQTQRKVQKGQTTNQELDKKSRDLSFLSQGTPEAEQEWNELIYSLEKVEKEKKLHEFSIRYTKRMLEDTIRGLFHSIESSYDDIVHYEKEIQLKQKELGIAKVKYSVGKISKHDYELLKTSLEAMKQEKQKKRLELQKQKLELNKYLKLKNFDEYTLVAIAHQYKPIEYTKEQLESHALRASHTNMSVVAKENGISLQQLLLDQNITSGNRKIEQEDVYIEQTEVLKLKEDIREGIKREYAKLKLMEEKINLLLQEKETKKQELENNAVLLKYGKISKFSMQQKKTELTNLDRQYTELIKEYELAKIHFENLYVGGSNL